jgi:hypothetical protein
LCSARWQLFNGATHWTPWRWTLGLFEFAIQGFSGESIGIINSRLSPNPPRAQVSTLGEHQVQGREGAPLGGPPPFWPNESAHESDKSAKSKACLMPTFIWIDLAIPNKP